MTKQSKILIGSGVAIAAVTLYYKQQQMNAVNIDAQDLGVSGAAPSGLTDDQWADVEVWMYIGAAILGLLLVAYIVREVLG